MNPQPDISIVIVSYNTKILTLACIDSIYEHTHAKPFEIIVVDNASTDGSAEAIADRFPQARVIRNTTNRGFGTANNQGMTAAQGQFLLLLNSDTHLNDDALGKLHAFAEHHPDAGVIGCAVYGPNNLQQETIFRFFSLRYFFLNMLFPSRWMRTNPLLGRFWYYGANLKQTNDVDVISGCCMLLRKQVFEQSHGFDESFFMYTEEFEWCHRIKKLGWRIVYFPGASITHLGGQSTKLLPENMYLEMSRSQVRFFYKTSGPIKAYTANLLMMLRDLPKAAACLIISPFTQNTNRQQPRTLQLIALRFVMHFKALFKPLWLDTTPINNPNPSRQNTAS